METMEDSNLRRLWRPTNSLIKVRKVELTKKDVKNEDRSDYVYENKGKHDKMTDDLPAFFTKMRMLRDKSRQSSRLFAEKTHVAR